MSAFAKGNTVASHLRSKKRLKLSDTVSSTQPSENKNYNKNTCTVSKKETNDVSLVISNDNTIVPHVDENTLPLSGDFSSLEVSPKVKKRRVKKGKALDGEKQSLSQLNQDVFYPTLGKTEIMVGFTPAGQRHEVDLNFLRPTSFSSEHACKQFNEATRINVTRMLHEMETGAFLPGGLDPEVESKYVAEQELVRKEATEHFKKQIAEFKPSDNESLFSSHLKDGMDERFLEVEQQLIELNAFAVIRFRDFPAKLIEKLNSACSLEFTQLMFKKNPIIIETLETLAIQSIHVGVAKPARALLEKIKDLFDVPEYTTFQEHFASEVNAFKEKTKDMNSCDLLMLSVQP